MGLIDKRAAIEALSYCQTFLFDSRDKDKKISLEDAEYAIEQLPSTEPERKRGKWIHGREIARECLSGGVTYIEYEDFRCSECGYTVKRIRWNADGELIDKYCSFCGADLRETKI